MSEPRNIDRLNIALMSARVAKATIVKRDGVGEDLPLTLIAWWPDSPAAVLQARGVANHDATARVEAVAAASKILRRTWGAEAFTAICEAFTAPDDFDSQDRPLAWWFAQPDSPVEECLTIAHNDRDGPVFAISPYRYDVGRVVTWSRPELYRHPDHHFNILFDAALDEPVDDIDHPDHHQRLIGALRRIDELGFDVISTDTEED